MPLVIMVVDPADVIGIMPGFWLLNLFAAATVGGLPNPVFFTATGMIGMIALAGHRGPQRDHPDRLHPDRAWRRALSMREAILESGAVRLRPILLTAGTTMLGAWPITLDPIFSGLAWSLIFGLLASTAFTLIVIPVVYYALYGPHRQKGEAA